MVDFRPIHGLIFLFKYVSDNTPKNVLTEYDEELFFANQVINNACATQALLAILMNKQQEIEVGDELERLYAYSQQFSSKDKGLAIGNSDVIKNAHNSFARQDPFDVEVERKATKEDDCFHFVSYLPFKGQLYELDGMQKGPISYGPVDEDNWMQKAREEI